MRYLSLESQRNSILLAVRILMMVLFVLFGWQKLTGFGGTIAYMTSVGTPLPVLSATIAVVVELGFGLFVAIGLFTRPIAIKLAVYTVATAFIGHRYWTLTGMDQYIGMINFYKNISIAGGLLLLALTGPGRYSFDKE